MESPGETIRFETETGLSELSKGELETSSAFSEHPKKTKMEIGIIRDLITFIRQS